ncbi:MAG: autotransporter outer membrane beta-barrel domain-containing protein, partial [Pseudomonadota bacterium]
KEIHPSAQMAALHSSLLFVETMRRRADLTNFQLGDALAEAEPFGEPPEVRSQAATGNVADASRPQWGIWGAGMGSYTDVSNQGTVTGWEAREAGIAVGLEGRVTTEAGIPITVGAAVGAIRSDVESGTSDAKIDSWHLGLYAAAKIDRLSIGGAAAYAYHDYDFTRPIAFGGGSVTADGGADGHSLTASMEAFFNLAPDPEGDAYIGPVGSVGLAYGNRGSFTETGAGVLNLSVSDDKALQAKTQIGIAAGLEREIEGMKVKLDARLQWEHVFGDTSVTTTSAIPVAGASFSTTSAAVDRDRLGVGLGAGLGISENATAHIRYDGAFGADTETHAISGGVTFWF